MIDFSTIPLLPLLAITAVLLIGAHELGWLCGARARGRGGDDVSSLESATLGLLALMIGFTFAMALSRYDSRRDALLNEANAIGTTALRARLLPAPHNTQGLDLLREYTRLRLKIVQTVPTPEELAAALQRSNAIQEELWQHAKAVAVTNNGMVPTGLFIQTLNEMIDNQEKRLTALRNRVPGSALLGLYGIAAIAIGFVGYNRGLKANTSRLAPWLMGLLVAAVILLIHDLDRPNSGFITVSQQPMIDAAASLAGYKD